MFANAELMKRASIMAPQATRLASALTAHVSPAFEGLSEVSDIVDTVKELLA